MSEHPSDERPGGRLHGTWDAALHLLDRQIVDDRGRMVGKVDDVELTERPDGTLEVTGLLLGPPALLPRLSTRAFELWQLAEPHRADREKPGRIDIAHVTALTSAVRLGSGRQGIVLDGDPAGVVIDAGLAAPPQVGRRRRTGRRGVGIAPGGGQRSRATVAEGTED